MNKNTYAALAVLTIAACTWLTRGAPFLLFGGRRGVPPLIRRLATALPEAIMVTLVLYCLRATAFSAPGAWLPQVISTALVAILHIWRKNALLSIFVGTAAYMALIRLPIL